MLKGGTYIDKAGDEYQLYHLEMKGFDRFDICEKGAPFSLEPSKVLYSRVQYKDLFIKGERKLYAEYIDLNAECLSMKDPIEREGSWQDGKYVMKEIQKNDKIDFLKEVIKENGILTSTFMQLGDRSIHLFTLLEHFDEVTTPLDFLEYERLSVEKTIPTATPFWSMDTLRGRYDIGHIDKTDSVVADTIEVAKARLYEWANSNEEIMSVDTETTGTDIDKYGEDTLTGIVLGEHETKSTYFPYDQDEVDNLPKEFFDELLEIVKKNQHRCCGHNVKFERKIFKKTFGADIRIHYDTWVMSFLITPLIRVGLHALKGIIERITGKKYLELTEIFTSANNINFRVLPKEHIRMYACPDGYNNIVVFKELRKKLPPEEWALYEVECEKVTQTADFEYYGLRVNMERYQDNLANCNFVLDMLMKLFRTLTHLDGNINSANVLSDLLYRKMHCPILAKTKKGYPSTSGAVIKALANKRSDRQDVKLQDIKDMRGNIIIKSKDLVESAYPALLILDKYREYNKRKTAFYNRFNRTMKTGRIFFWVNQLVQSGRQSSPMHQLPPEMKELIIADTPDHRMIDSDYSAVELRMLAYLAGETELIELAKDPDNDIHRIIGHLITNEEIYMIDAQTRSEGKPRNFGVVYLISAYGLALNNNGPNYTQEHVKFWDKQIRDYFTRFKRINRFIKENCHKVQTEGKINTKFYRYRYFPEILDPDVSAKQKSSMIRQGNNTPVQGTSADLLKIAETNFLKYIDAKGWSREVDGFPLVRLALTIHDEAITMAHKSIPHEEVIKMIRDCMEITIKGAPPFFVSPAFVDNWEGHNDDSLVIPVRLRDKLIDDYESTGKSVFYANNITFELSNEVKEFIKNNRHSMTIQDIADKVATMCDVDLKLIVHYIKNLTCDYVDTNYLQILEDYRNSLISNYMNSLIAEYGDDPDVVYKQVKHPSLTHELIGCYKKRIPKGTAHLECIRLATKYFIEGVTTATPEDMNVIIPRPETELSDKFFDEVTELVDFDENGNVIYTDDSPEIDEDEFLRWDDESFIKEISTGEIQYVWEFGDRVVVDCEHITYAQANELLKEIHSYNRVNGFYKVYVMLQGKMIDTKMTVEDLPFESLNAKILNLVH